MKPNHSDAYLSHDDLSSCQAAGATWKGQEGQARRFLALILLLVPSLCAAQAPDRIPSETIPASDVGEALLQIKILPGDTVSVAVFDVPELSRDVRVSQDGLIKLPLLEPLIVGGLTEAAAAHRIDEAYLKAQLLLNPQASVFIREFASKGVSILGEVAHPNVYPVPGPPSLLDLIALAGGLTASADTHIDIKRRDGTMEHTKVFFPVDNGPLTLENDVSVAPGDRIVVPRARMIYVLGEVARPGGYIMQVNGNLSILQAIAAAGGTTRVAGENNTRLIRRSPARDTTEVIPLHRMLRGKLDDRPMQAADVLYVPGSITRDFLVNAPAILGSLAGAAIYSINR